jgi:hypothetical protein
MVKVNQDIRNNTNKAHIKAKDYSIKTQDIMKESLSKQDERTIPIVNSKKNKKQNGKIYHQNICGLESKIDELLAFLHQLISLEEYNLGANFCRQSLQKGGVCTYINK